MKKNNEWKFKRVTMGRGFVGILALGVSVTVLTVRAVSDDSLPISSSDRQQIVAATTGEEQGCVDDTRTLGTGIDAYAAVPVVPRAACCGYAAGVFTGVCTARIEVAQCRASGGVPVGSCFFGCPTLIPQIGTEGDASDTTGSTQEP